MATTLHQRMHSKASHAVDWLQQLLSQQRSSIDNNHHRCRMPLYVRERSKFFTMLAVGIVMGLVLRFEVMSPITPETNLRKSKRLSRKERVQSEKEERFFKITMSQKDMARNPRGRTIVHNPPKVKKLLPTEPQIVQDTPIVPPMTAEDSSDAFAAEFENMLDFVRSTPSARKHLHREVDAESADSEKKKEDVFEEGDEDAWIRKLLRSRVDLQAWVRREMKADDNSSQQQQLQVRVTKTEVVSPREKLAHYASQAAQSVADTKTEGTIAGDGK